MFRSSMFCFPPIHIAGAPEEIEDYAKKYEALYKMLLEKGADPSLLVAPCEDIALTIFAEAIVAQSAVGYYHSIIDQSYSQTTDNTRGCSKSRHTIHQRQYWPLSVLSFTASY